MMASSPLLAASTTISTSSARAPSYDELRRIAEALDKLPALNASMAVRESHFCVTTTPARAHKKRRSQSDAYHRRIQKKWTKRYGSKSVPCAYVIDTGFLSPLAPVGKTLFIHPALMPAFRAGTINLNERTTKQ